MFLNIKANDLVIIIKSIQKTRAKRKSKKFDTYMIELSYLAGLAVFVDRKLVMSTPAKGEWTGTVLFPKAMLYPYIKNNPSDPFVKFTFNDGVISVGDDKAEARFLPN